MRPERSLKAATALVLLAGTTIAATGAVPAQAAGSQFTGTLTTCHANLAPGQPRLP